jgi:hypothetical protein
MESIRSKERSAKTYAMVVKHIAPTASISHYRANAGGLASLRERARFYARCSVFEEWPLV